MSAREGARRLARGVASIGTVAAAVLVPKCPMCVAAALSVVGVGASLGFSVAPFVRPLAFVVALATTVAFLWRERDLRRRRACAGCVPPR